MSRDPLKAALSRMGPGVFTAFVREHFARDQEPLEPHSRLGEDVLVQELLDSYGGSIHRVHILDYTEPLLERASRTRVRQNTRLRWVLDRLKHEYRGQVGQWGMVSPYLQEDEALHSLKFVTNIMFGATPAEHRTPGEWYFELAHEMGIDWTRLFFGSLDSFFELDEGKVLRTLEALEQNTAEGLSIELTPSGVTAALFRTEPALPYRRRESASSLTPVILGAQSTTDGLLRELSQLIESCAAEADLEAFLSAHYRHVFGFRYDRIETQLWLRFPELDIGGRERRLDLFLRDSIQEDWEIVELKRPIELVSSSDDIPTLRSEFHRAVAQLRAYQRLLGQDAVRRRLAAAGFEYFQPAARLVIGRRPRIPLEQWRYLRNQVGTDLTFDTYDDLLAELRLRH